MDAVSWVIVGLIAVWTVFCVIRFIKKKGRCCNGSCQNCSKCSQCRR